MPDTTDTPDAIQLSAAAYYNKLYKGAAYRIPCQPGGGLLLPCADRWQVLTRCQQYRPGAPAEGVSVSTRRGSPAAGERLAAAELMAATAVSLFGLSPDSQ